MGRDPYSHLRIVEYPFGVHISDLLNAHVFEEPCVASSSGKLMEKNGINAVKIADYIFTVKPDIDEDGRCIIFQHTYRGHQYTDRHHIVGYPVHFGGFQYYFSCSHCGRQVETLYFGGNAWACRTCCHLVYQNCRESRSIWRKQNAAGIARKKADRLRAMNHPRLENRLEWKAHYLEEEGDEAQMDILCQRYGFDDA